jgi:hypothetical protein
MRTALYQVLEYGLPPQDENVGLAGVCRREPPDRQQRLCGGDFGSTGGGVSGEGKETGLLNYPQRLDFRSDTIKLSPR